MRAATLAIMISLCCSLVAFAATTDDESFVDQKKELERLESDVKQGRQRLDSLQGEQREIQKQISDYDQKIASDRQVIRRLNNQLDGLRKDITQADSLLLTRQQRYERADRRYLGSLRYFYMIAQQPLWTLTDDPNEELKLHRKVTYLAALANFESASVDEASRLLGQSAEELEGLTGQRKMIDGLKKKRETSYALGSSQKTLKQKSLDQLKRKSMVEADRIITLEKAAEEMTALVARLEEERAMATRTGPAETGPSVFASLKRQLPSPYRGKIVLGFGEHIDPITRLKSFSPGITIEGKAGRAVYAVASGTVAYAGNLRGYGNFVIIRHDHQYYTTYAGLGKIEVSENQYLQVRTRLGTSAADGVIKFELRRGRESLDPVEWINIESL